MKISGLSTTEQNNKIKIAALSLKRSKRQCSRSCKIATICYNITVAASILLKLVIVSVKYFIFSISSK